MTGLTGQQESVSVLNPITNSKLSPDAKVTVLETYGLPRLTYRLVHRETCPLGPSFVDEDRLIREAVKRWCNATRHSTSSMIYAPARIGELGVTELKSFVLTLLARAYHQYIQSSDPVISSLATHVQLDRHCLVFYYIAIDMPRRCPF